MPAEGDRHLLVAGRDDRGRDRERVALEPDVELEPVAGTGRRRAGRRGGRSRARASATRGVVVARVEHVPVLGGARARRGSAGRARRRGRRRASRSIVDRAARGDVAPVAQPVRPRVQQREAERLARPAPGVEPAALDEQLLAAMRRASSRSSRRAGTNVARSSPAASTTASSWPAGCAPAWPRGSLRDRLAVDARRSRDVRARLRAARCASSPASRIACCSSSPPSSRASGAAAGCGSTRPRRRADRRRGLRGRARRRARTPRPRPPATRALGPADVARRRAGARRRASRSRRCSPTAAG